MNKVELKLRIFLRKIFKGISFTTVAFVFQACYGSPIDDRYSDVVLTGTVTSKITNLPIKGIKIAVDEGGNYGFTDENGKFSFYTSIPDMDYARVRFSDIDSTENGYFADKTITIECPCSGEVKINAELEERL